MKTMNLKTAEIEGVTVQLRSWDYDMEPEIEETIRGDFYVDSYGDGSGDFLALAGDHELRLEWYGEENEIPPDFIYKLELAIPFRGGEDVFEFTIKIERLLVELAWTPVIGQNIFKYIADVTWE